MTDSGFEPIDDLLRRLTENRDPVGALIEATLLDESESLVSAAYNCAIPRTFYAGLLIALSEEKISDEEAADLLEKMKTWEFVQEFGPHEFAFRHEFREYLRSKLQKDDPERFIRLNERAYAYFASKLPDAWDINERLWLNLSISQVDALREAVYHLLQYDTDNGFRLSRKMFERAVRLHRIEETFSLIKLLKQIDVGSLTPDQHLELSYFDAIQSRIDGQIQVAEEKLKVVVSRATSSELKAKALTELGKLYFGSQKPTQAIESFFAAQKIWESLRSVLESAALSNNIGTVYLKIKNYERAERAFLAAVASFERLKNAAELARALNNLGKLYGEQRDWDKSRLYYERSLLLKNNLGDLFSAAITRRNIGRLYLQLAEDTQNSKREKEYRLTAEGNLNQSLNTFRQFGAQSDQAHTLLSLSVMRQKEGRITEARQNVHEAIEIYSILGMSAELARAKQFASRLAVS